MNTLFKIVHFHFLILLSLNFCIERAENRYIFRFMKQPFKQITQGHDIPLNYQFSLLHFFFILEMME